MAQKQLYDRIGVGYAQARRPDPRIAAQVLDALGDADTVVSVGAGTGNYEPHDRPVVAVEPNEIMIAQRSSSAPVVRAVAEALPFRDRSFDAALAMFTIHHWPDRVRGLLELGRVACRQVALVYEPAIANRFWLVNYFDGLITPPPLVDPTAEWMGRHLSVRESRPVMVPADCTDGFTGCYWNRPERYLDPAVQAGMSTLARLPDRLRHEGSARLRAALDSGDWDRQYGHLRDLERLDIGYRLVICES